MGDSPTVPTHHLIPSDLGPLPVEMTPKSSPQEHHQANRPGTTRHTGQQCRRYHNEGGGFSFLFVFQSSLSSKGQATLTLPVPMHAQSLSRVQHIATPWTVARQAPLSMEFPRQEHWSRLPCPPPGDLPELGIDRTHISCIGRRILYH